MKDLVKPEDIKRLDELYHTLIRKNISADQKFPDEIKDLSALDLSVLNLAASNPGIIVREIAKTLNIPNSTLTSCLNRLEKKELVRRMICSRDKRSFALMITPKGWRVQKAHLKFERAYFESILSKLDTEGERSLFLDLVEKIVRAEPFGGNSGVE